VGPYTGEARDDNTIEGACEEVGSRGRCSGEEQMLRQLWAIRKIGFSLMPIVEYGSEQFIERPKRCEPLDLNSSIL
jgi:hypothetical protein